MTYLYHYFERAFGPFKSIADRPLEEAREILLAEKAAGKPINPDLEGYLQKRYNRDRQLREAFLLRGGQPQRTAPVFMVLGQQDCQWASAYENPDSIQIPLEEFDPLTISFTYGNSFAVLSPALFGPEEYWGQVYFADEILGVIERHGYPPHVEYDFKRKIFPKDKPIDQHLLFVEAHVWSDEVVGRYREAWRQ